MLLVSVKDTLEVWVADSELSVRVCEFDQLVVENVNESVALAVLSELVLGDILSVLEVPVQVVEEGRGRVVELRSGVDVIELDPLVVDSVKESVALAVLCELVIKVSLSELEVTVHVEEKRVKLVELSAVKLRLVDERAVAVTLVELRAVDVPLRLNEVLSAVDDDRVAELEAEVVNSAEVVALGVKDWRDRAALG